MTERRILTLYPDRPSDTWMVRHHDDEQVQQLFGCDALPTAFTLAAPAHEVRHAVETRNPDARVRLVNLDGTVHED